MNTIKLECKNLNVLTTEYKVSARTMKKWLRCLIWWWITERQGIIPDRGGTDLQALGRAGNGV